MFSERKAGAGGETRTLMSVTSPDFESGAYTNFATPADMDRGSRSGHIRGRLSNRQPPNADSLPSGPSPKRWRGRKIRVRSAVKERLPITCRCYTILGLVEKPAANPTARHQAASCPKRDSQLF